MIKLTVKYGEKTKKEGKSGQKARKKKPIRPSVRGIEKKIWGSGEVLWL